MLVSCRWLKDYADYTISEAELADRLTMAGASVETITEIGRGLERVVIGRVVEVAPHPGGGTLQVCQVDCGGELLSIVCGAPNVAADERVPVALPGAKLPSGQVIDEIHLQGVLSQGMICSEAELGLGDDAGGIMVLPSHLPVGEPLTKALPIEDVVLDVEVYPNRPDLLSMVGMAREVAALTDVPLQLPDTKIVEAGPPIEGQVDIQVEDCDLCPRYTARFLTDCRVGPSPLWMQRRLIAAGMRPINNIVDITNYVMLESGQPLHAFDYDKLIDRRLVIRRAKEGERITTLDDVDRELTRDDLVIADGQRPVCIAGVMGSAHSEVDEGTTTVLLESANFNPVSIRRTSQRLGLRSEASSRFEKGLDPNGTLWAINRAAQLMQELAGAQVAPGVVDIYPKVRLPLAIQLCPKRTNDILGTSIEPGEMARLLEKLTMEVQLAGGQLHVTVPTFRGDIQRPIDLVEEVARLYGYDKIEPTLPQGRLTRGEDTPGWRTLELLRDYLVGRGFLEALTLSFTSPDSFQALGLEEEGRRALTLRNPLTVEQSKMRTTLLPGLLGVVAHNLKHDVEDLAIFELGSVFLAEENPPKELPREETCLGIAMVGRTWEGWGTVQREVDFFDLKGVVEGALAKVDAACSFAPSSHPAFHPGRQAQVQIDGQPVGVMGEIHPQTARAWDIDGRVYICEINLQSLLDRLPTKRYRALPRYPMVKRDLALLVPEDVSAGKITELLREVGGELVREAALFDYYKGPQIPEGFKSLAYTVTFQAEDRTLTDSEVGQLVAAMERELKERLGVTIRR
ncbi:MAG: phenylalanine--tRNA ligase subunit beta [Firmicutes bacterium]|nr:phenylalanine--tRNA ligase subunit beta [Bacillota bacterium]